MKNFEFKSQVATSVEQSKRLLELGLKKETADIHMTNMSGKGINYTDDWQIGSISYCDAVSFWDSTGLKLEKTAWSIIPAWSLHRLLCMLPKYVHIETYKYGRKYMVTLDLTIDSYQNVRYLEGVDESYYDKSFYANDAYESICKAIEWLIKEGYFNKDYLEEKK